MGSHSRLAWRILKTRIIPSVSSQTLSALLNFSKKESAAPIAEEWVQWGIIPFPACLPREVHHLFRFITLSTLLNQFCQIYKKRRFPLGEVDPLLCILNNNICFRVGHVVRVTKRRRTTLVEVRL